MKKFLILGYPRSGTNYTYEVLKKVLKEKKIAIEGDEYYKLNSSAVGWDLLDSYKDFDIIFHQTRNFFNILNSIPTIHSWSKLSKLSETEIKKDQHPEFYNSMVDSWINFNFKIEKMNPSKRYKVEDVNEYLIQDLLRQVDIDISVNRISKIIKNMPKNINTRKKLKAYNKRDKKYYLQKIDPIHYNKIKKYMDKYGYNTY